MTTPGSHTELVTEPGHGPIYKTSAMLFPLCSLSGVARLAQVLLPKDGKGGKK